VYLIHLSATSIPKSLVNNQRDSHVDQERTVITMLKTLLSLTAATAVFVTAVTAYAFTLTNKDQMAHQFTIYVEDDEWDITIQANETLKHLCRSGCSIAIGYGREKDFKGREIVFIEDGRMTIAK
jgi:cbb3-type cytochrome oxidase subunit 3